MGFTLRLFSSLQIASITWVGGTTPLLGDLPWPLLLREMAKTASGNVPSSPHLPDSSLLPPISLSACQTPWPACKLRQSLCVRCFLCLEHSSPEIWTAQSLTCKFTQILTSQLPGAHNRLQNPSSAALLHLVTHTASPFLTYSIICVSIGLVAYCLFLPAKNSSSVRAELFVILFIVTLSGSRAVPGTQYVLNKYLLDEWIIKRTFASIRYTTLYSKNYIKFYILKAQPLTPA